MVTKILHDYTCFDNDSYLMTAGDPLQQVLNDVEEKNAPLRKIIVRKAIELYTRRHHLKMPSAVI